jgi:predicted transglutaminase-like cysteine proteinase
MGTARPWSTTAVRTALATTAVLTVLAACSPAAASVTGLPRLPAAGAQWFIRGWETWCRAHTCAAGTPDTTWSRPVGELARVNAALNTHLWVQDVGGDVWRSAAEIGGGDCEDFAIAKRDALQALGWPLRNLRFAAMVHDEGEAHVVLLAWTRGRWWALDQRRDDVVPPAALPYTDWHLEPIAGPTAGPMDGIAWEAVDVRAL